VKLAALAAAALLAPTAVAAPPRAPEIVTVAVGHDRARGFVTGDERVMTVAHVLGAGDEVVAGDASARGGGETITVDGRPATIVRLDRERDLAVLRVPGLSGERPRFGGGGETRLLGRPAPVVRRIRASVDGGPRLPALEIRADVEIGDSGASLTTPTGRVAGMVFARSRTRPEIAYAVALDHSSP
jgi:hypothetical protein